MRKEYKIAILLAVIVVIYFLYTYVSDPLVQGGVIVNCPPGMLFREYCGPISYESECYFPMNDSGKECSTSTECLGNCQIDLVADGCERVGEMGLWLCDKDLTGICTPEKLGASNNQMYYHYEISNVTKEFVGREYGIVIDENYKVVLGGSGQIVPGEMVCY